MYPLNTKYLSVFFGMLLTMAACQKIDTEESAPDWKKESVKEPGTPEEPGHNVGEMPEGYELGEVMKRCGVIDGHVVLFCDTIDESTVNVTFLSKKEWTKVPSAHSTSPEYATRTALEYREGSLTGWRMPTKAEAMTLRAQYGNGAVLNSLNELLWNNGGDRIYNTTSRNKNIRFLCEDATYTFCFITDTSITKAGTKTTYNMRLLKDSTIVYTQK